MPHRPRSIAVTGALAAALAGALFLTWTDKRWPEVQEAMIGVTFVLAATGTLLLLAANPHGGEHLRDLLIGQILWVTPNKLVVVTIVYAVLL
ncbi:MAG TPA: metal ABC transporter permease, partial [Solirubrobacteraceae bacterium]